MSHSKPNAFITGTAGAAGCGWLVEHDDHQMLSSGEPPFEAAVQRKFRAAVVYFRDFPRITA